MVQDSVWLLFGLEKLVHMVVVVVPVRHMKVPDLVGLLRRSEHLTLALSDQVNKLLVLGDISISECLSYT